MYLYQSSSTSIATNIATISYQLGSGGILIFFFLFRNGGGSGIRRVSGGEHWPGCSACGYGTVPVGSAGGYYYTAG